MTESPNNSPEHDPDQPSEGARHHGIEDPVVAYTAEGNLEVHSAVGWLVSNGVPAYAVEDQSGASLFAFGTLTQYHGPTVFVSKTDLEQAKRLLIEFEDQRDRRRKPSDDGETITAECEECNESFEFPASQDGTTQNCPKCYAYMDVGTLDWPEDFDFEEEAEVDQAEFSNPEEAIDAASRLEEAGDWSEAIDLFKQVGEKWPEHLVYAQNCISQVRQKIDAARS